jgi:hypothetical protein
MMAGKSRLMSNLPILTPELFFSILYYVNTTVNTIESASITYTLNGQVRKTVQGKSSSSGHSLPPQRRTACSSARAAFFVFACRGRRNSGRVFVFVLLHSQPCSVDLSDALRVMICLARFDSSP